MATAAKTTPENDDGDEESVEVEETPQPRYRTIRNPKQLPKVPKRRCEPVDFPELEEDDGSIPRFFVRDMTAQDYSDLQDTNKIKDEFGNVTGYDYSNNQEKTLAIVLCDDVNGSNRLWDDWQEAVEALKEYPVWMTARLVLAADRVAAASPVVALKKSAKAQS